MIWQVLWIKSHVELLIVETKHHIDLLFGRKLHDLTQDLTRKSFHDC